MEEEEGLIAPRQPYSVASAMPHVRSVADSARKSIYRGYQFVTTTPTSRYVAAVLSEATHYVLEQLSQSISSLQTHDPEWSYTDEVKDGAARLPSTRNTVRCNNTVVHAGSEW